MNPNFIRTNADQKKVIKEYLNNLRVQASNNQLNYNANIIKEETGMSSASLLPDLRSTSEKFQDINTLKTTLSKQLQEIMDIRSANKVFQTLSSNEELLFYVIQRIEPILKYFKENYSQGVPSNVFINVISSFLANNVEDTLKDYGFDGRENDKSSENIKFSIGKSKTGNTISDNRNNPKNRIMEDVKKEKLQKKVIKTEIDRLNKLDEKRGLKKAKIDRKNEEFDTDERRKMVTSINELKNTIIDTMNRKNINTLTLIGGKSGGYTTQYINTLNSRNLLENLLAEANSRAEETSLEGSGIQTKKAKKNIILGSGIKVDKKPIQVDFSNSITPTETYIPFGKFILNQHRLNNDILMMRYAKGGYIKQIPTKKVSKAFIKVMKSMIDKKNPSYDEIKNLNESEKEQLYKIVQYAKLEDQFEVPSPEIDKDNNQFEIMKGEILAGNDSKQMIKDFKLLLLKLMNNQRIPRKEAQELLTDLATMGY